MLLLSAVHASTVSVPSACRRYSHERWGGRRGFPPSCLRSRRGLCAGFTRAFCFCLFRLALRYSVSGRLFYCYLRAAASVVGAATPRPPRGPRCSLPCLVSLWVRPPPACPWVDFALLLFSCASIPGGRACFPEVWLSAFSTVSFAELCCRSRCALLLRYSTAPSRCRSLFRISGLRASLGSCVLAFDLRTPICRPVAGRLLSLQLSPPAAALGLLSGFHLRGLISNFFSVSPGSDSSSSASFLSLGVVPALARFSFGPRWLVPRPLSRALFSFLTAITLAPHLLRAVAAFGFRARFVDDLLVAHRVPRFFRFARSCPSLWHSPRRS
ncbi:hypothetical protein Tco_1244317 [Tanacetum coccineum]